MFALLDPVEVNLAPTIESPIWVPAVVVGRTIECAPRYDIRLPSGETERDIPYNRVRRARDADAQEAA